MNSSDLQFRPKLHVLDRAQIDRIHHATLDVLERTGVRITHSGALDILAGAGANVENSRVRIPASLVEDAIGQAPSRVVLGRRDGSPSVFLEGDRGWFGPSLDCIDYLDPDTGERRPFTNDDCRVMATVADALPNYSWVMTVGLASDAPADTADRVSARQALTYCEKPLVFCCKDLNSTRDIYQMAVAIAGSEERFHQAPTIVHYSEPISPLVHYDPAIDKLIFCAEKGIPLIYYPAPQSGGTAPATAAGTVVQANAESLSGLVLAQLVQPGSPFIYGALATILDMSTMVFSYGAPEMSLMTAALSQLAQHYGLPFFGTAGCSDAKFPDPQAAAEAAFSCLSSGLSGANLIHDCGWLDHGSVSSPACMALVHELLYMVNQFIRGIPVNDETLAVELIDSVGPGGQYLAEEHTYNHFREVWYSKLFDRSILAKWTERGSKSFDDRLREQTLEVMKHEPSRLPPDVLKELDQMSRHWQ
ncbi:MAG: trimethylamine methyltransferase family protein [Planctomycetota bacterium]|jgi:trimethylamine--corrinoid protein Co-methyltransferase|nr:trimethylamine methyltransferase family protein [Planctomycetota bacterium]